MHFLENESPDKEEAMQLFSFKSARTLDYSRRNTIAVTNKEDETPRRLHSLGNTDLLLGRRATLAPLSARNQNGVTTSGVSATESKLIITLRK